MSAEAHPLNADNLDIRLLRFRSRRDEYPLSLATALLEAGRIPEALEVVQVGLVQSENDAALLVLEGRAWFEQGDLPQAQAALLRAAKASPRDKEPYRWLSQVLMKRGEPGRAVQVLERALQIDPADRTLQQAHMRAQRLARIASEADGTEAPRHASGVGLSSPAPASPASREPKPFAAVPDSALPLELSRPATSRPPSLDEGDNDDDEPTMATSLPPELRNWLDAERSARETLSSTPRSSNDNHHASWTHTEPPEPAFEEESQPTLATRSAELLDLHELDPERDARPLPKQDDDLSHEAAWGAQFPDADASAAGQAAPGDGPAEPEPPEQVLALLSLQGIFEPADVAVDAQTWVPPGEAPRAGNRIGRSLAVGWLLVACAAGGGYYGFTRYIEHRRSSAQELVARAERALRDGQSEALRDAERDLKEARALDPKARDALEALLLAQATRVSEEASGDVGVLRDTSARAKAKQVPAALLAASDAVGAAYGGDAHSAEAHAARALELGAEDARVLYLVGRLYQRSGREQEAAALFARAVTHDPAWSLAYLAQGELLVAEGRFAEAKVKFTQALGKDGVALAAELWSIFLDTGADSAPAQRTKLMQLADRVARGSTAEQLLAVSTRAHVLSALGDRAGARAVLREGQNALAVTAPARIALFAQEALAVGELDLAVEAADRALRTAPTVTRYRALLVAALLQQGDGDAAWSLLAPAAEEEDALQLVIRARAALLSGKRAALEDTKAGLLRLRAAPGGKDNIALNANLVRVDLQLGASGESLLPTARGLAQRSGDSVHAQLALAEAALAARQGSVAVSALAKARALAPEDGDVFYVLGRAQRMTGNVDEAKASLRRALELAPRHRDARFALAGLLLDAGDYAAALELYLALEQAGAGLSASLGVSEARLGQGDLDGAEQHLEELRGEGLEAPAARALAARLKLARGQPEDAVKVLEPLVHEDSAVRSADLLALYGDALYESERVDSAAGAYEAALELDDGHPEALVGRAMAAVRAEKGSQARDFASRADAALRARARPPALRARLLLIEAKAELLSKNFYVAKVKLSEAVALAGVPSEAYFWYGETLAKTKSPGASEQYAKYLELAPNGSYAARAKKALAPR